MSSSIKLTNSSGKIVTITNPDTTSADVAVDLLNNAYTIATVDDFGTVPVGYTTVIVKDTDRGGIFVWSASGTANGGTVFAGSSGYWIRQYDGAINVKWFGAVGDSTELTSLEIANNPVGSIINYSYDTTLSLTPQNISNIKNSGKSLALKFYVPSGSLKLFQHNQAPYGINGIPDNEYNFSATDHSAIIVETMTKDTSGNNINQDRSDGNRRPDKASFIHRLNCFSSLPKNTFQLASIWQHEDLTPGAEQPELDGTFLTSWFYDTNTSTYSTKNPIYIQNFAKGNSQVEVNRKFSNYLGYVGINTYDCKGYQHHIYSSLSGYKASLLSSNTNTVKQTLLSVSSASPDLYYNQIQNGAYNFGFTYMTGGAYGRNYAYIRASGTGASLGSDITNGTMFAHTDANGASYKSRTIQQQVELGTSPTALNILWTSGSGSPEGVITAPVGSIYSRTDGGASTTLYVKESGTGNTGWIAK